MPFYEFKCNYCAKSFKYQSVLDRHERSHSGDKPFLCNICGKNFTRGFSLSNHMKIHYGIKDHACHICNTTFHSKSNLNQHLIVHTDERPYSCDICDKKFKLKHHVKIHKKRKKRCVGQSLQWPDEKSRPLPPPWPLLPKPPRPLLPKPPRSQLPLLIPLDTFMDAEFSRIIQLLSNVPSYRKIELIIPEMTESESQREIPEIAESESQREIRIRNLVTANLDSDSD